MAVSSPKGVQAAVMKLVEKYGKPIVLYIKDQGYVTLDVVKALVVDPTRVALGGETREVTVMRAEVSGVTPLRRHTTE